MMLRLNTKLALKGDEGGEKGDGEEDRKDAERKETQRDEETGSEAMPQKAGAAPALSFSTLPPVPPTLGHLCSMWGIPYL